MLVNNIGKILRALVLDITKYTKYKKKKKKKNPRSFQKGRGARVFLWYT